SGVVEVEADGAAVDQLGQKGDVPVSELGASQVALYPNACVLLRDKVTASHSAVGRHDAGKGVIRPLRVQREGAWGVRPRNVEQSFALDLLMDDSVHLVTLVGKAGTGKTLLAIAAGLKKVIDEGVYARLLVSRPIFPLGRDVGYLPGDLE